MGGPNTDPELGSVMPDFTTPANADSIPAAAVAEAEANVVTDLENETGDDESEVSASDEVELGSVIPSTEESDES